MSKQQIHNYYFGSDIFNIHSILNNSKSVKKNYNNTHNNTSNRNVNGTLHCNYYKAKLKHSNNTKSIDSKSVTSVDTHLLNYDPNYYWNKTKFVKQYKERILKLKGLPKKNQQSIEYDANVVKFRKYGSSLSINSYLYLDTNNKQEKKSKQKPISINESLSYLGEDVNKTPLEISMRMRQSNIFNSDQKENENTAAAIGKNKIKATKTKSRCLTQECWPLNVGDNINVKDHPKLKSKYDKTITKEDDIKIVKDYFENKESANVSRHIDNVSTLYNKNFYNQLYSKNYKMTNGVIHKYELNKSNDYNAIDTKAIKQLFRKKGINVFKTENHDSFSYGKQKCIIQIRTNENDSNQINNMNNVINEIENSTKVNFKQIKEKSRMSLVKSLSMNNSCSSIKEVFNQE